MIKLDLLQTLKSSAETFSKKFYNKQCRASYMQMTIPKGLGRPSDLFILDLALKEFAGDTLVYLSDKLSNFDTNFINRVRMNTIKNSQVSMQPYIYKKFHFCL